MRRHLLTAVVFVLFSFGAGSAFATCPTPYYGPYSVGGPNYAADYTQNQACYSTSGSISSSSISCFTEPSWSFSGTGYATTSFTIGPSDWVGNPAHWEAGSWVDFSSPSSSVSDQFEIDVTVEHPNHTLSYYTVTYWNGAYGSISSCSGQIWSYFTADVGDTVTVLVRGGNSGTGTVVVSVPRIFSVSP